MTESYSTIARLTGHVEEACPDIQAELCSFRQRYLPASFLQVGLAVHYPQVARLMCPLPAMAETIPHDLQLLEGPPVTAGVHQHARIAGARKAVSQPQPVACIFVEVTALVIRVTA